MSRFEELCQSYNKLLTAAEKYESDCKDLLRAIVYGFVDFLDCGRNDLVIKQLDLKEDGYYHCSIELTVYENENKHSSKGLVPEITLKLGRDRNDFIIKLATGSKVFSIDRNEISNTESPALLEFYEYMFRGIKSYYESPVEEFVHNNMSGLINFG